MSELEEFKRGINLRMSSGHAPPSIQGAAYAGYDFARDLFRRYDAAQSDATAERDRLIELRIIALDYAVPKEDDAMHIPAFVVSRACEYLAFLTSPDGA